jgi:hypothetical protein
MDVPMAQHRAKRLGVRPGLHRDRRRGVPEAVGVDVFEAGTLCGPLTCPRGVPSNGAGCGARIRLGLSAGGPGPPRSSDGSGRQRGTSPPRREAALLAPTGVPGVSARAFRARGSLSTRCLKARASSSVGNLPVALPALLAPPNEPGPIELLADIRHPASPPSRGGPGGYRVVTTAGQRRF